MAINGSIRLRQKGSLGENVSNFFHTHKNYNYCYIYLYIFDTQFLYTLLIHNCIPIIMRAWVYWKQESVVCQWKHILKEIQLRNLLHIKYRFYLWKMNLGHTYCTLKTFFVSVWMRKARSTFWSNCIIFEFFITRKSIILKFVSIMGELNCFTCDI